MEFGPLVASGLGWIPVADAHIILRLVLGDVDQLQNERPPSNDTAAAGQKISTDNVLEN